MARRLCLDCPALAEPGKSRCKLCQAVIERVKWQHNANRDPDYRRLRESVAARLPVPCALCGEPILLVGQTRRSLTLDHIRPVADGGSNDPINLRPVHRGCNSRRGRQG